jgi:WXG100 family type VII secretion target
MALIVDFGALDGLVQDLSGIENTAQSAIQTLEQQLNQNLAEWNGAARDLYIQRRGEWQQGFQKMSDILVAAKNHVLTTNEVYQATESKNVGMWS